MFCSYCKNFINIHNEGVKTIAQCTCGNTSQKIKNKTIEQIKQKDISIDVEKEYIKQLMMMPYIKETLKEKFYCTECKKDVIINVFEYGDMKRLYCCPICKTFYQY